MYTKLENDLIWVSAATAGVSGICMFDTAISFIETKAITGERVQLVTAEPSLRCFYDYKCFS